MDPLIYVLFEIDNKRVHMFMLIKILRIKFNLPYHIIDKISRYVYIFEKNVTPDELTPEPKYKMRFYHNPVNLIWCFQQDIKACDEKLQNIRKNIDANQIK